MRKVLWVAVIILALLISACDYEDNHGVTVFRGWVGRLADALHELHGGEPHEGRR